MRSNLQLYLQHLFGGLGENKSTNFLFDFYHSHAALDLVCNSFKYIFFLPMLFNCITSSFFSLMFEFFLIHANSGKYCST